MRAVALRSARLVALPAARDVPRRGKQSQAARIGIFKPTTLKMHSLRPRRTKPRPTGLIPVVEHETPAVASHWPVGATAPTEDDAEGRARMFAAIAINGKQYKVAAGDVLVIDRVVGAEVGTEMKVDDVLLVGSATRTVVGRPLVPGATVSLAVEQQTHAAKDVVFKKRRRKGYKKFNTFRRPITVLRVNDIGFDMAGVDAPALAAPASRAAEAAAGSDRA